MDTIYAAFPELRRGRIAPSHTADAFGPRRRRTMSADARKRMSEGMRRYWAKRKATAAKTARAKG